MDFFKDIEDDLGLTGNIDDLLGDIGSTSAPKQSHNPFPPPRKEGGAPPPPPPRQGMGGAPPPPPPPRQGMGGGTPYQQTEQEQSSYTPLNKEIQASRERVLMSFSELLFDAIELLPTLIGIVNTIQYTRVLVILTGVMTVSTFVLRFFVGTYTIFTTFHWSILFVINGLFHVIALNSYAIGEMEEEVFVKVEGEIKLDEEAEIEEEVKPTVSPASPPNPSFVPRPLTPPNFPPSPPLEPKITTMEDSNEEDEIGFNTEYNEDSVDSEDEWEVQTAKTRSTHQEVTPNAEDVFGELGEFGEFSEVFSGDDSENIFGDNETEINLDDFTPKEVSLKGTKNMSLSELLSEAELEDNFKQLEDMDNKLATMLDMLKEI